MSSIIQTTKRNCACCLKHISKIKGKKKTILTVQESVVFSASLSKTININDILCPKCRIKAYRKKDNGMDSSNSDTDIDDDSTYLLPSSAVKIETTEKVLLPIPRTVSTHSYCCLCKGKTNLQLIPEKARTQAYVKRGIYVPVGNRCCQSHIIKDRFYESDLTYLSIHSNTSEVSTTEITNIIKSMSIKIDSTLFNRIKDQSISEEQIHVFTGLSWENINDLTKEITSMRNNSKRTVMQALIIFFTKLRTGGSNRLLCSMFELEAHQQISEYCHSVIEAFENDILLHKFGMHSQTRRWLIDNQTSSVAKKLHNTTDCLILICDGTYCRHEKSSNNDYQRKSFSGQKKTPLCKPFTICTTTGYIVDMLGPFLANLNDAAILRQIIDDPNGLCTLMQAGDIFVLDRGFRDVVPYLESKGFKILMPALKGNRKQLSSVEANESRFVTKLRWAVEAVHGMLKEKNLLLSHTLDNKMLTTIKNYYRIASFCLNRYGKKNTLDDSTTEMIILRMNEKRDEENVLIRQVEEHGWLQKKLPLQPINSTEIIDFPEFTEQQLIIFFTGKYQMGQAMSYLGEMFLEDGTINMQFVKDQSNILKMQVQSRHMSRKRYRCFVEYIPNCNEIDGIKSFFCECACGLRTVSCCSHIAAIVYYLSHGRFLNKIPRPAEKLSNLFKNGLSIVINENSDEDY